MNRRILLVHILSIHLEFHFAFFSTGYTECWGCCFIQKFVIKMFKIIFLTQALLNPVFNALYNLYNLPIFLFNFFIHLKITWYIIKCYFKVKVVHFTLVDWFTEKHELEDHDSFGLEFEGLLLINLLIVLKKIFYVTWVTQVTYCYQSPSCKHRSSGV